jgi:elongation factor P
MITAGQFKKGTVITWEGAHWMVEDYHIHKTAQRRPVLQTKLRNMKTGHVVERSLDEADRFEQPELQARMHQFLYHEADGAVFMDAQTFDQITVPFAVLGNGKWVLKGGEEFLIRLVDSRPVEVVLPPTFVDEVVETADPSSSGHNTNVLKEATLACGLVIKVPQFIKVGEHVKVDTATHKYHGKESVRR